ncbi:LEUCINE-RICH REPEAT RECEPTOR-LIKE PROTEIN KINASE FAMILY PROTEIN-RELATED [Salix koriyanagi]|uniref:LEUCINE-RICH REPEAT RECEPTOR-LIKE PROTEIN KINASE FAMILY PROTEIN-RELATED n=1 Tax=Salix koriyanagi TaxID=2511006 RepID=A0A9Q0SVE3_9ROSI|nr:LEUCINE-RICH REPEAT RECEPTOR-LIKE PROTEIN KINASE FAMILY PROTEIN-RELATED [Salix koriyanagi]
MAWWDLFQKEFFSLKKLNKLLLLSNNLSGEIPPEIGNCSSLIRFRANNNKVAWEQYHPQIGNLKNLNFLDLGSNRIAGNIPEGISGCQNLTFLDLHSNAISRNLPQSLNKLVSLQFVDFSDNLIEGTLSASLGSLGSLKKLILSKNKLSGSIPNQLGSCSKLQLLDLSGNQLSGNIPSSIGKIPSLEIALNLSLNQLNGEIPSEFTGLTKLAILDFSYNHLSGDLQHLAALPNLVVLTVSHNNFSGHVPDTPFFSKLPLSVLTALYIILGSKNHCRGAHECDSDDNLEMSPPWEVTLYQKLDLSIADVARSLTAGNVIGQGRSGVVYKVAIPSGLMVAVKRFNSAEKISAASFSSEIATLATIRHRNIVRLLGWGANLRTNLLFYDYMANGTLGALLHEGDGARLVEWETRFKIALGVAEGLAYLHHAFRRFCTDM